MSNSPHRGRARVSNPVYISMEPLGSIRDLTVKFPTPGEKSCVKSPGKSPMQPSRGRVGQHIDRCIRQAIECDKSSTVLHRLPVRLVTRSGVKRKWFQKKKNKKQLVVNRGRVRRVTFGTGAKVVESAGVVRVNKNDPTGN